MRHARRGSILLLVMLLAALFALPVSAAGISKGNITLTVGHSTKLKVFGAGKKVKWSSSNKKIAAVNKSGTVRAVKAGSTRVLARVGRKTYSCKVKVIPAKVAGNAKRTTAKSSGAASYTMSAREKKVYRILMAAKKQYPEGKAWGNRIFYAWDGGSFAGGYGGAAFVFLLSDAAFGSAQARIHSSMDHIMVGDILRVDHNTHSVIVLKKTSGGVVVAEGNYSGKVHWGRTISWKELGKSLDYIVTRYEKAA